MRARRSRRCSSRVRARAGDAATAAARAATVRARIARGLDAQGRDAGARAARHLATAAGPDAVDRLGHDDPGVLGGGAPRRAPPPRLPLPARVGNARLRFPAALGAQAALPADRVLAVAGRRRRPLRAAGAAPAPVSTGSPATLVIVDDGGYGILREYQAGAYGRTHAVDLVQPDFAAVARGFGVSARACRRRRLRATRCAGRSRSTSPPSSAAREAHRRGADAVSGTLGGPRQAGAPRRRPVRAGPSLDELMARHGLAEVAKLNWNEGLWGPLPGVLDAVAGALDQSVGLSRARLQRAARGDRRRGRRRARAGAPGPRDPGPGPVLLAAFVRPGDAVAVPEPTYELYAQAARVAGARVVRVPEPGPPPRPRARSAPRPARADARIAWVCDPNNPTGSRVDGGRVAGAARRRAARLPRRRRRGVHGLRRARRRGRGGEDDVADGPPRRRPAHVQQALRPRRAAARLRDRRRRAACGSCTRCRSRSTSTGRRSPRGWPRSGARPTSPGAAAAARPRASGFTAALRGRRPAPAAVGTRTSCSARSASTTSELGERLLRRGVLVRTGRGAGAARLGAHHGRAGPVDGPRGGRAAGGARRAPGGGGVTRLTEEQREIQRVCREFAAREIRPAAAAVDEADVEHPAALWDAGRRAGADLLHAARGARRRRDDRLPDRVHRAGGALARLRRHRQPAHLQRLLRRARARPRHAGAAGALGRAARAASGRRSPRWR